MKLAPKILILVIGIASITAGVLVYYTYSSTKSALQKSIGENQLEITRQALDKINRLIYERLTDIDQFSSRENLIAAGEKGSDIEQVNKELKQLTLITGPWDALIVSDIDNNVVASSDENLLNKTIEKDTQTYKAIQQALKQDIYYSDLIFSTNTQTPTIIIAKKIGSLTDPARLSQNIVIGYLSWPVVNEILHEAGVPSLHLYNREGYLIGDNKTEEYGEILKTKSDNPVLKRAFNGEEGTAIVSSIESDTNPEENELSLTSFANQHGYASYKGSGWIMLAQTSVSTAFLPATQTAVNIVILFLPIVAVAVFLVVFSMIKFIVKPIQLLTRGVITVSQGNFNNQITINSKDEVGILAREFNSMALRLKSLYGYLEEQVAEKTRDLQKFQLAVENAYEHIVITDENSRILYVNNTVEKITGYSRAEVLGKTPAVWGGKMPDSFYKNMWDTIKTKKKTFIGEIKNKRKNGEEYFASINISPILDEKNEVKFFVGIERDITHEKNEKANIERKIEERTSELKEEHARLKASIGSLSFGFVITDIEKKIITINEVGRRLLCASITEFFNESNVKKTCSIEDIYTHLLPSLDIKSELDKVLKTGSPISVEIQIDNHYLLIRITPIVIADLKVKIIGTVIVCEDITERKLLDRTRDEFFSIASHELRTPLTAIRGNTSLILQFFADKLKDPELKEMIGDVNESSIRLIQIVNDFLDMSRLELGKIVFKREEVDIVKTIKDVIKEYETTGSFKMLYLNFNEPKEATPILIADPDRVKQIIINLIGNGIKYTQKGGIAISLENDGKFIKVLVADTGKGIAAESQKLLFRKFQQAVENIYTRDSTKGTGLGLYISKLMAEGMGGSMALESSISGKGSVFSFSLPIIDLKKAKKTPKGKQPSQNPVDPNQVIQSTK